MIAKLKGTIDTLGDGFLILDVHGVGYLVACSHKTLARFQTSGENVILFIETVMRQENLQLYGFYDQAEQDCFRLLTTVQGVGMKVALAILSALTPSELYSAILSQNKTLLTRAEGVGPKLAARILNELKEKEGILAQTSFENPTAPQSSVSVQEALLALTQLGYKYGQASEVLREIQATSPDCPDVADLIRKALAKLSRTAA